jgi:hypothetical protein
MVRRVDAVVLLAFQHQLHDFLPITLLAFDSLFSAMARVVMLLSPVIHFYLIPHIIKLLDYMLNIGFGGS